MTWMWSCRRGWFHFVFILLCAKLFVWIILCDCLWIWCDWCSKHYHQRKRLHVVYYCLWVLVCVHALAVMKGWWWNNQIFPSLFSYKMPRCHVLCMKPTHQQPSHKHTPVWLVSGAHCDLSITQFVLVKSESRRHTSILTKQTVSLHVVHLLSIVRQINNTWKYINHIIRHFVFLL